MMNATTVAFLAVAACSATLLRRRRRRRDDGATIVFLGTGSSAGTPFLACLLGTFTNEEGGCPTCSDAATNPRSANNRGNPCILLRNKDSQNVQREVLIDMGKTFRDKASWILPRLENPKFRGLDAVLITHDHADAFHGLDEMRTVQRKRSTPTDESGGRRHWTSNVFEPIQVFAATTAMPAIRKTYPYLMPSFETARYVASATFTEFQCRLGERFTIADAVDVEVLPIEHGKGYLSSGFLLRFLHSRGGGVVAYLSDVSGFPEKSLRKLKSVSKNLSFLIIDALHLHRSSPVHLSVDDSLALVRSLRESDGLTCDVYLIGISHENDHVCTQAYLDERADRVFLASDGLEISI